MDDLKRSYDATDLENRQLRKQLADLAEASKETVDMLLLYLQNQQPGLKPKDRKVKGVLSVFQQPVKTPEVQKVNSDTRTVAKDGN
jgi:hypothetical protein